MHRERRRRRSGGGAGAGPTNTNVIPSSFVLSLPARSPRSPLARTLTPMLPARLAAALLWMPAALAASGTSVSSRSRRHQAPPPPAPPDAFAFDDDVLRLLSGMSLKQKVGQMTQIDVTQLVSFTGSCRTNSLWEDPVNCQPELNYDRLRSSMLKVAWLAAMPMHAATHRPACSSPASRPPTGALWPKPGRCGALVPARSRPRCCLWPSIHPGARGCGTTRSAPSSTRRTRPSASRTSAAGTSTSGEPSCARCVTP